MSITEQELTKFEEHPSEIVCRLVGEVRRLRESEEMWVAGKRQWLQKNGEQAELIGRLRNERDRLLNERNAADKRLAGIAEIIEQIQYCDADDVESSGSALAPQLHAIYRLARGEGSPFDHLPDPTAKALGEILRKGRS